MPASRSAPILIVDDDGGSRHALSQHLLRAGWQIWEATTGAKALEIATRGPEVIIVDMSLPDMAGQELCRRLKSDPATRGIPILHTSNVETRTDDAAIDQGADAYLTEPIDPKELVATVRALSRVRMAEAKAEVNLAKLEAVINCMVEGVITADLTGRLLTMNPAALRIHGFSTESDIPPTMEQQDELIERTYLDGTPIPRQLWPVNRAARGETVTNFEMRVRRRDTGRWWIGNYNATLVKRAGSGEDLVIVTFFDITDRKRAADELSEAQQRLQTYADELEHKVEERTSSLREAISQMEEFSYTVSHDLRAPLRSIKGYADILLHEYGSKIKGEGLRYLERIIENGERMERLVNDVLTISRISNAKLKLGRVSTGSILDAVLREYVNLSRGAAKISVAPLPDVVGHESLCIQVFSNLLGNAVKFVRPGAPPEIRIWAEPAEELIRINVEDNGIGISPEFHQKIFGMFERLDTDNRYGGTGIGLAIVRRAVEKMNGRVGVVSDGHSGSRFWIELPAWTGAP